MRFFYSMGRAVAARLRLEGARPLREQDSAAFPPGTHTAEVAASFRDGTARLRGAGGRELVVHAREGRRAPPAGARVRVQVELRGDVDVLVVPGSGEAFVVDSVGAIRHEAGSVREAMQWITTNNLQMVKAHGRLA